MKAVRKVESVWLAASPYLALAALAFVVYANALDNRFAADDNAQLLSNPLVVDYHKIPDIFGQDSWAFSHRAGDTPSNYYRPVQILLYMALYHFVDFSAAWFHFAMIAIHAANTLLVFHLGRRFLTRPIAMAAGALFAVHPIHSEAVVWIAALPDIFMTLVALVMLLLLVHRGPIVLQAALFLLALLTKETSAAILPLLAAYELLCLGRDLWKNRALYAALLAVFGAYIAMRVHALGSLAPSQGGHFDLAGAPLALNIVVLMASYLGSLFVPPELNYFHIFHPTTAMNLDVIVSVIAITAVVAGIILLRRRNPEISFGLLVIIIPLLPVMNINGVGENVFAERYLYLPSVGFAWIAAWAWAPLANRHARAAWSLLAMLLITWSAVIWARTPDWQDDLHLYEVTARQSPGTLSVRNQLGAVMEAGGRHDEAIWQFRQAIAQEPRNASAHYNLGKALENSGQEKQAEAAYETALRLQPDFFMALNNLAKFRRQERRFAEALEYLKKAVDYDPTFAEAWINLGLTEIDIGDYASALPALRKGLALDATAPFAYIAHYGLGVCEAHQGDLHAAERELILAARGHPEFTAASQELQRVRKLLVVQ